MRPLSLEEVRRAMYGRWLTKGKPATIRAISIDTRTARPGELFIAIRGKRLDGHAFLAAAARAGCPAAVIRRDGEPPPEVARNFPAGLIAVRDTVRALGQLAAANRRSTPAAVVAVTGSNGKTTVKRMIHHVLSRSLAGTCSPKSFNNEIGVPLTLLGTSAGDDYVVCEIGSSAPGEIAPLARMAEPDVAVITGVAETHLERFGSVERVAVEKASILGGLRADGLAIVRAETDASSLERAIRPYNRRVVRFGETDAADLRLTGYEPRGAKQRFELNGRLWVDLPLPGRHNALNALAAIAVAQRFGVAQDEAAAALADVPGAEMRLQWIECGPVSVLNDTYNANPSSMLAAAEVLGETTARRRVFIAGDMLELGETAGDLHLRVGEQIARRGVDLLIGVGPLGRCIAKGAASAVSTEVFDSVDEAVRGVADVLREGDVVLIKGSRGVRMERLMEPIQKAFGRDEDR